MAYVDRRSLVLRYHVKRLFSLSQMRTRSVFHCGPRNEKQTRTLTDAEDCCEDVCIVLICGWSVDVLWCLVPGAPGALCEVGENSIPVKAGGQKKHPDISSAFYASHGEAIQGLVPPTVHSTEKSLGQGLEES